MRVGHRRRCSTGTLMQSHLIAGACMRVAILNYSVLAEGYLWLVIAPVWPRGLFP